MSMNQQVFELGCVEQPDIFSALNEEHRFMPVTRSSADRPSSEQLVFEGLLLVAGNTTLVMPAQ